MWRPVGNPESGKIEVLFSPETAQVKTQDCGVARTYDLTDYGLLFAKNSPRVAQEGTLANKPARSRQKSLYWPPAVERE